MIVPGSANPLLFSADEGYNLTRSLRFRSSASAHLGRTFSSAGNRKTWTLSFWVKRGSLGSNQNILVSGPANTNDATFANIGFSSANAFTFTAYSVAWRTTTQVFRDPSAWYHIIIAWDTTQSTAADRVKIYVNGSQVTAFSSTFDPSLNFDGAINQAATSYISLAHLSYGYFDGYLAEAHLIDGQALTPSSFGETDLTTGVWKPKRYAGTYGTNGFYLPFTDNSALTTSSNAGLGKDFSGNGNYWTTNNISITAGVTYDSMTDVPTLTSATAANFAVLNPLDKPNGVASNGNLQFTYSSTTQGASIRSTIGATSGKWYCEVVLTSYGGNNPQIGIIGIGENISANVDSYVGKYATGYAYNLATGNKLNNTTATAYGSSLSAGDIAGIAFDADARTITFYKNNVSQGTAFSSIPSGAYCFAVSSLFSTVLDINFGQRPFAYTPPSGFVALNTFNLPTSTIVKGNTVMDATLYTGNGSTQTITNAAGFKPDLVWAKVRSNASWWHILVDSVRGAGRTLSSNVTNSEFGSGSDCIPALNSNGFNVNVSPNASVNENGASYVGWQWQAGQGTTSTNTSGTITSTVSVNASAGFSVVTYTGTGANATVGHGLGVAPSMIICKSRGASTNWGVWHTSLTSYSYFLLLNSTAAQATAANALQALPTSTLVSLGASSIFNDASTMVMYAWTPIAGYSAFGSYTGNGSTDGPFVYTGFRPKFVLAKRTDTSGTNWLLQDSVRGPYNLTENTLYPNLSDAEATGAGYFDLLSNGFKLRTSGTGLNASGGTYIYMCFAENPFKNALAR